MPFGITGDGPARVVRARRSVRARTAPQRPERADSDCRQLGGVPQQQPGLPGPRSPDNIEPMAEPVSHSERMREIINTPGAPTSRLYSQGIKAAGLVYVSGLVGIDVATGQVAGPSIQEQTRQAISNCEAVLRAAGATLADVIEVGVLLHDPDDFAGMNEEWAAWFSTDPPTRSVARLGAVLPGILISVRMVAALP